MVITRFAPSPTGNLHIGGARTALFNWLYARNQGGKFLLRIEDTDKARSETKYVESILESFSWLGIDYDDSLVYQSERASIYKDAVNKLLESGDAYYCDCTKEELASLRTEQQKLGLKPKYDGRNRDLSQDYKEGSVVRFKTPLEGEISVEDTLKGEVTVQNSELDDLIIQRADGTATYNLTVVVDDIDMGVTNVIRGDDHLNNTYRQIHMMHALGYKIPQYTHIPLIMGEDRKRLSKRHGAVSAYDFRDQGILPISIINYLARLGWASGDKEKFTLEERISESSKIMSRHTDRVPIVVEAKKNSNLQDLDKHKYLVPKEMTIGQFLYVIRKRLKLKPDQAIFVFVDNKMPSTSELITTLYERSKNEDGFMYILYSGENTFG